MKTHKIAKKYQRNKKNKQKVLRNNLKTQARIRTSLNSEELTTNQIQ